MKNKFNMSDHCCKLNVTIVLLFAIGSILTVILIIQIPTTYAYDESCKDLYEGRNLWKHTWDTTPSRFVEHEKGNLEKNCITVTGKVVGATPPDKGDEKDGDYHFSVLLDTTQYSNENNCHPKRSDCKEIIAEIVCYGTPGFRSAIDACKGYASHIGKGPQKGDTVTVTGKWVQDVGVNKDHNWNEIHPVTKLIIN